MTMLFSRQLEFATLAVCGQPFCVSDDSDLISSHPRLTAVEYAVLITWMPVVHKFRTSSVRLISFYEILIYCWYPNLFYSVDPLVHTWQIVLRSRPLSTHHTGLIPLPVISMRPLSCVSIHNIQSAGDLLRWLISIWSTTPYYTGDSISWFIYLPIRTALIRFVTLSIYLRLFSSHAFQSVFL